MDLNQLNTILSITSMGIAGLGVVFSYVRKDVLQEETSNLLQEQIVVVNELAMKNQRELADHKVEHNMLATKVATNEVRFSENIGYMKDTMVEIKDMIKELKDEVRNIKRWS